MRSDPPSGVGHTPSPQVEEAEARPVPRAPVVVAGDDEVAPRVRLEDVVPRPDPVEQDALRVGEPVLSARLDGLPYDARRRERVRVPVAEDRARQRVHRLVDRVFEHVDPLEVDPGVFVRMRPAEHRIRTQVQEIEPRTHVQEVAEADLPAWVVVPLPFGNRRRVVEADVEVAGLDRGPDEGARDALPLRPRDLRCVAREAGGVALAEDLPRVNDDDCPRVVFAPGHRPVESRLQSGHVDLGGRRIVVRARVSRGPRGDVGVRAAPLDDLRLEGHILEPVRKDRAPLVPVVLRVLRRDSISRDRGRARLEVHRVLEVVLPVEPVEGTDVLRHDFLDGAFVIPTHDEHAGAEVVRGHPGDVSADMGLVFHLRFDPGVRFRRPRLRRIRLRRAAGHQEGGRRDQGGAAARKGGRASGRSHRSPRR